MLLSVHQVVRRVNMSLAPVADSSLRAPLTFQNAGPMTSCDRKKPATLQDEFERIMATFAQIIKTKTRQVCVRFTT